MAFSDWTFNISNGSAGVDPTLPLTGTAALRLQATGNSQSRFFGIRNTGGGYTRGLTKGRMRTLFRVSDASIGCGFVFMASTLTPATVNSNYYEAGKHNSANQVMISRTNTGMIGFTSNLQLAAYTFAINTTYAMQIEWILDDVAIGGLWMSLALGTALDFSNLTQVLAWTDPTSTRLATTVGEGIGGAWNLVPVQQVVMDQTTISTLTL